MTTTPRRFVQIHCTGPGHYVALADDGTAWEFRRRDYAWFRLPSLPDHAARRPKPPSLAEQALALINHDPENQPFLSEEGIATIRAALERLQELENNG